MWKIITAALIATLTTHTFSQTNIEKVVPLSNANKLELDFVWPDLVTIKGWDSNEIKLEGMVNINNGLNDEAFKLRVQESGNSIKVSSYIENHDRLPKRIVIKKDGQIHFFNTDSRNDPEVRKYLRENGSNFDYMSHGVLKEIQLVIYVPSSIALDAYCKYGLIEFQYITGALSASSKYGGIDISVGSLDKKLKAGTRFGEKYSDLSENFSSISFGDQPGEWDWISYGVSKSEGDQEIQSEFGNIYIRKKP